MKNITVIGGGVLGSQIALQAAYCNFDVTIYLRSLESMKKTQNKILAFKEEYIKAIKLMGTAEGKTMSAWCRGLATYDNFDEKECLAKVESALNNIKYELDLKKSVANADLVIESLTENFDIKKNMFLSLSKILPTSTIVVTNSSTLLPSKLAKYTGRPDKFLALHFANSIWKNNTAEVMKHDKTSEESFNKVLEFAKNINMIALPLQKEKSGYLLNSMLIPFLFSSLDLYVNGVSTPEYIDKAWVLGTGAPEGPFQILDVIGLNTAYEIVKMYLKIPSFLAPYNFKKMAELLEKYIKEGKLGKSTKEGFYKYEK